MLIFVLKLGNCVLNSPGKTPVLVHNLPAILDFEGLFALNFAILMELLDMTFFKHSESCRVSLSVAICVKHVGLKDKPLGDARYIRGIYQVHEYVDLHGQSARVDLH